MPTRAPSPSTQRSTTEVITMLRTLVSLQILALTASDRIRKRLAADSGQSTAEYALVLLGAAGVALLLVAWATKTDKVTRLLNSVLDRVLSQVS